MPYYYAVKNGRVPGVYSDWASCQQQVKSFPKARYKKCASEAEAYGFVWGVTVEAVEVEAESHSSNAAGEPSFSPSNNQSEAWSNSSYVNSWVEKQQHLKETSFSSSSIAPSQNKSTANLDQSAAAEAVAMLRATAKTLQSTAEQLMKGVGALSTQIEELAASVHSGGGGVRDHLKRSYSDCTPLGKSGGTHGNTSAPNAAKKSKKAKLDSSGSTDRGFTGSPFPDDAGEIVYTDGSAFGNGLATAKAGIGIYWGPGNPHNTSERLSGRQTNNRAEIHAAEVAVLQAKERGIKNLILHTDSQFLINGITGWIKKWKKNGWKLSTGGDVINREDFEKLDEAIKGINVKWIHVRGHQGIEGNEAADKLANDGARKHLE